MNQSLKLNPDTLAIFDERWRLTPARLAENLTRGRFQRFRHIQFLDRKLAQSITHGRARIVISMPPRHGKSWLTSLYTPVWFLSLWPDKNVILTSYEATFAATWGRQVRNCVQEHQGALGIRLSEDSLASDRWNTLQGGGMVTAGIGGPITGRGGSLLIVDDPVKNWEEASSKTMQEKQIDWFNSTLYTRAEPGASIIILMTRWNERDLAGYLLSEHQDSWEEIKLAAIAEEGDLLGRSLGEALCPERYDIEDLKRIKASVGTRIFASLYQQRPSPEEGNLLKRQWLKFYATLPERFDEVIQSWDLSFKDTKHSDFTVGQCWGRVGSQKYLIDQVRARMDFPKVIQAIRAFSLKHPAARAIVVEDKANGPAVIAALQKELAGIIPYSPTESKIARVNAISPQFESGCVYLPDPKGQSWVSDLVEELVGFPNSRFDDSTDCLSQALLRLGSQASLYDIDLSFVTEMRRESPFRRFGLS